MSQEWYGGKKKLDHTCDVIVLRSVIRVFFHAVKRSLWKQQGKTVWSHMWFLICDYAFFSVWVGIVHDDGGYEKLLIKKYLIG